MTIFPRIVDYKGNAALQLVSSQTGEILFTSHKEGGQYKVIMDDNIVEVFKTQKFSPGLITILLAKASWLPYKSDEGANDYVNRSIIIMPDGNVTDILTGNGDSGANDWLEAYVFKLSNDKLYPIYISTPDQSLKVENLPPQIATLIEFFEINRDEVKFDLKGLNQSMSLFHENLTNLLVSSSATSGLSVHLLNIQEIGNEALASWVAAVKLNGKTYLLPDLVYLDFLYFDVVYNDPQLIIHLDKVWNSKNLLVATTYLLDNNWQEILILGEKGEVALFVSPNQPPSEMRAALEVYELHDENGSLVKGDFTHSDRYKNYKPYYELIDRLTTAWSVNKNDHDAYNEWIDAIVSMNQDQSGEETPYISPFAAAATTATEPVVRPASPGKEAMIDFLHPSGSFRQSSGGFGIGEGETVNENPFAAKLASASFVSESQFQPAQAQFQPAQAQFQPAQQQPQVSFVPAGTQFTPLSQPPSNVPLVAPVLRTSSNKGPRTASKDIIQGKTNFMDFSNGIKLTFPNRNNLTLTFNNGQLDSSVPLSSTQQSQIIDLIRQTYDRQVVRNELLPRPEATASRYAQLKVDISPNLTNEHKFYLQQLFDKRMAMAQEMQKLDSLLGLYGIKGRYVAPPTPAALNPADFPEAAREVGLLEYPIELIRIYQQIEKLL